MALPLSSNAKMTLLGAQRKAFALIVFLSALRIVLFAFLTLILVFSGWKVSAQTPDRNAPIHNVDGAFVREWLVLGPFPSRDLETDFLESVGGEANVRPKEGDTVTTKEGKQLVWTRLRSNHDVIDLERVLSAMEWSVVYAYCELTSGTPIETDARIEFGQAGAIWLNGKSVGQIPIRDRYDLPPVVPAVLNAGQNPCLLKIRFEFEPPYAFGFQPLPLQKAYAEFHIVDSEGRPVRDALVQFYDRGEPVAQLRADDSGKAEACLYPLAESYDVRITSNEMGTWLHGISFRSGERRRLKAVLQKANFISGKVLAMDGSPQVSIVVQALNVSDDVDSNRVDSMALPGRIAFAREPQINPAYAGKKTISRGSGLPAFRVRSLLSTPPFTQSILSDTNGNFRFVNLRPGRYQLRAHAAHGYVYPVGLTDRSSPKEILVEAGSVNENVKFVFAEAKKAIWNEYPLRKGLAEVNPSVLHRTPDGMLWIGTFKGSLHSFDGVELKEFSAPETSWGDIRAIAHDGSGTLWIGAQKGISRIVSGRAEAMPFNQQVSTIHNDWDGTVWFSTTSGLVQYDGKQFQSWGVKNGAPGNSTGALLRTQDGQLWMSTIHSLARFDGRDFSEPVLLSGIRQTTQDRLYQSEDGAIWFSSRNNETAVYRFDGTTLSRFGKEEGLICGVVNDIAETSDGNLWFATDAGLSRFDGTTILTYPIGQFEGGVQDIFVDSDDVLWCAAFLKMLRFDPKGFVGFTKRDGLMNKQNDTTSVFAIEPDGKGGYLIGSEWCGLNYLTGESRDQLIRADFLATEYVRHILRSPDGTLWFGTSEGIYKHADGRLERVLERSWINALDMDDQGQLWFGHGWIGGGVSRFNPKTGAITVFTRADGLPDDSVWAIEPATGGGVWIGTSGGLAEFQNNKIQNVGEKLGIRFGTVSSLGRDADGSLWIGGDAGGKRLKGTNLISVASTDGIQAKSVWSSVRTSGGLFWIGTDNDGLIGTDGEAVTMLDKRDGLLGNSVFSLRADTDDSLLIGFLGDGLTRYRRTKTPPSIRLVAAQLEDQTYSEFANLPTTEIGKRVSVQYQEIDLKTHPEKRQFRYHVEGPSGEKLFSGITKDRRFEWTPKKGGNYSFEVQAIDRDLNYSKPVRLTFKAIVPWYANAWITAPGSAAVAGLSVWAFVALALYRRKSREAALWKERMRIARDLHDNLGAGLTHLAMVSDQVRQRVDEPREVEMLANRLTNSARELTRTMGEIIWMTDPAKGTLQHFVPFLTSYAERFFAGSTLRLRFEIPAAIPDITLPEELRRNLFLAMKEALNNVAKHAHASELKIKLELAYRELHLSLEDDGCGFSMTEIASRNSGNGLVNMEKRLHELGGQLRIESAAGQGTRIFVKLHLPKY